MRKTFLKMALLVASIISISNAATNGTNSTNTTNSTSATTIPNYATYNFSCGAANPSSVAYKLVSSEAWII